MSVKICYRNIEKNDPMIHVLSLGEIPTIQVC